MITIVLSPFLTNSSIAYWTWYSLSASRALVASSKIKIDGFLIRALAIAILCFYPPLNFTPLSPTIVSSPNGNRLPSLIKFKALAIVMALVISS